MAKVLGVGGIFFKCSDPDATMAWYRRVLGIEPAGYGGAAEFFHADSSQAFAAGARTVLAPFSSESGYFAPAQTGFMINLMVDDLDAMLERIATEGVPLAGTPESHDYGKFAWVMDPNGIKIELWEPVEPR